MQVKLKRFFLILLALILSCITVSVFGQLTKEEKKALKSELKQYKKMKPIEIKVLKEDADQSKLALSEAEADNSRLKIKTDSLRKELKSANTRIEELSQMLTVAAAVKVDTVVATNKKPGKITAPIVQPVTVQKPKTVPISSNATASNVDKGVIFKVQLGAYNLFNVKDKLSVEEGLVQELHNGMFKYVLGAYRSVQEAKDLRKEVIKMGIKDAWIVSYVDGSRVPLKDALAELKVQANAQTVKSDGFVSANAKTKSAGNKM